MSRASDAAASSERRRRGALGALVVGALVVGLGVAACNDGGDPTPGASTGATNDSPGAPIGLQSDSLTIEDAIADYENYEEWDFEEGGVMDVFDRSEPVSPAAAATGVEVRSAESGAWSDSSTWSGGQVPSTGDAVVIEASHEITIDIDAEVDGIQVEGRLDFDPDSSVELASTKSIVVTGDLVVHPSDASIEHVIEFRGIDESLAQGASMMPNGDVGVWVLRSGRLDLLGSERTGWTRLTGGVDRGTSVIEVEDAVGWRVGDEVVISPTRPVFASDDPQATFDGFHATTIASIEGEEITLADATEGPFPIVAGQYRAEVMNLTRNVVVRGTRDGRAHVFVHTDDRPQSIRWVALDFMGPYDVLGRYPLHFHHAGTSVEGSLIEGVVVRSAGNHAFVVHESHGVTMRDLVAIDVSYHHVYWWDEGDNTNDLVMEDVIAARYAYSGFFLGLGDNVALRNAVAVGGLSTGSFGGFDWENKANAAWEASDLVAHNNTGNGIRVWQNGQVPQIVNGYVAYHNTGAGLEHGAYTNRYNYRDLHLIGNFESGLRLQAVTLSSAEQTISGPAITFADMIIDLERLGGSPILVHQSALDAYEPVLFERVSFVNVALDAPLFHFESTSPHRIRVVDSDPLPGQRLVWFDEVDDPANTWLELIDNGRSLRYRPIEIDPGAGFDDLNQAWVAEIERPIPADSGDGSGLLAEYFEDADLQELRFAEVLPAPLEQAWTDNGTPYHRIDASDGAGARWSGFLEATPGGSGEYSLGVSTDVGVRMWLDGRLLVDEPVAAGQIEEQAVVELETDRRHELVIELYDRAGGNGMNFYAFWTRPDGVSEILPTAQLTPSSIPDNDPVVAVAED